MADGSVRQRSRRRCAKPGIRPEWLALGGLVVLSTGLRSWAALEVPVPWIAPDEMVYGLLGESLYRTGSLDILGGPTPFYSLLTPAFAGLPLTLFGLDLGYDLLRGLQALAMSLAAVPVYLWGRSIVSGRGALVAAALTLAVPGLAYSGLVMTEVLFYPLFVLAAWAGAAAIAEPTGRRQAALVLAIAAAVATRLQAVVLLPAFATALGLDAALARSTRNLRRLAPAAGGVAALALAWVAWRLASGSGVLGGYEAVTEASYGVADGARFVLYHAASALILTGLFPVCAVGVLLARGLRTGEPEPAVRAYLAIAASLAVWLVVEVGVFASRHSDRVLERNLLGLAPVLFLGLVLWLERGAPGRFPERAAAAAVAAAVLLTLPVKRLVNEFGTQDALTLIPLYKLLVASSAETLLAVYLAVAGTAAAAFALLPRVALRAVPVLLAAALATASVVSSRFVAAEGRAEQMRFLGVEPRWVDRTARGPAAYLYDGEPSWNGVWETLFWNRRIDRVYGLSGAKVPGPLPQLAVDIGGDGRLTPLDDQRSARPYAVVSTWFELVGERIAEVAQPGTGQRGLALWRIEPPLRLSTATSGLQVNGDVYPPQHGRLVVYDCTRGTFVLTLLIKEPETVDLVLNGRRYRRLSFDAPPPPGYAWRGRVPVSAPGSGGACTLDVVPSGLLGTTVFTFERS